jgi:type IV secretory pathway TrbF-like protein
MIVILSAIVLLGIGTAGIAIKIWAKKTVNLPEHVQVKTQCSTMAMAAAECAEQSQVSSVKTRVSRF